MFAGTDSKVEVTLVGDAEEWTPVLDQCGRHFESGKVDTFVIGREKDFGSVDAVSVRLAEGNDKWYLEKVVVAVLHTGREWVFHCGAWVDAKGVRLDGGQVGTNK
eukprot:42825-Pyramimonas_sp.AAC.1